MGSAWKGDYTKGTKRGVNARFFPYARVLWRHYRPRVLTVRAIESPLVLRDFRARAILSTTGITFAHDLSLRVLSSRSLFADVRKKRIVERP